MEFNEYYFVFLRRNPNFQKISDEEMKKHSQGHFIFQYNQFKQDNMILAGPLDSAGGIYIIKINNLSKDQLLKLLNDDPFVNIQLFLPEVHRWSVPSFFSLKYSNRGDLDAFYKELISLN